jgi:transcriptional regulator with XRE-family HTH domain
MTLGEKIKQLRLRTGKELSQKELAEKIDVEVTYLSKLENNKVQPYLSEETLNKVVKALKLSQDEERGLFELAKKTPSFVKEQAARPGVYEFLRTAQGLNDKDLENFIKNAADKKKK